jgi:ABC-type lipoprotein export system ATPase subunit
MSINAGYNLILADEPFNMLDDFEIENLKNTIIESSKNACFIITTHEDLLDDYSDNIIWLENGNIC